MHAGRKEGRKEKVRNEGRKKEGVMKGELLTRQQETKTNVPRPSIHSQ